MRTTIHGFNMTEQQETQIEQVEALQLERYRLTKQKQTKQVRDRIKQIDLEVEICMNLYHVLTEKFVKTLQAM